MMKITAAALDRQRFLHGMQPGQLEALAETATEVLLPARHRIFADGGYAGKFWLIRAGQVALDLQVPGEGPVVIETIGIRKPRLKGRKPVRPAAPGRRLRRGAAPGR